MLRWTFISNLHTKEECAAGVSQDDILVEVMTENGETKGVRYVWSTMVELRQEDTVAFCNFMRMQPEMFEEIVTRAGSRVNTKQTRMKEPLEPGLKLALALRHLA